MPKNNKNTIKKYKKIQEEFKQLMSERTPSGAKPTFRSVVENLAEKWCLSEGSIERILLKDL